MFEGLYFEYPKVLSFIVIFIACDAYCKLRSQGIYFPGINRLEEEQSPLSHWVLFLKWLGISLMLLAMMSPVRDEQIELAPQTEDASMLILDTTISMERYLGDKSMLSIAKAGSRYYLQRQKDHEVGLLLLNGHPSVAVPLTKEHLLMAPILEQQSRVGAVGDTAVALVQLVTHLGYKEEGKKSAILFSDERVGKKELPAELLGLLHQNRIMLYRIIFSQDKSDTSPLSEDRQRFTVGDEAGMFRALEQIIAEHSVEQFEYTFKKYYYIYPLFFSFFTFLIYIYLRNRRVT